METWKAIPLGFAIVDETPASALAVHHVSVTDDGVSASGLWKLPLKGHKADVTNLLTHWVPIGTRDGIAATNRVLGKKVVSADLASLVSMCEDETVRPVFAASPLEDDCEMHLFSPFAQRLRRECDSDSLAKTVLTTAITFPKTRLLKQPHVNEIRAAALQSH